MSGSLHLLERVWMHFGPEKENLDHRIGFASPFIVAFFSLQNHGTAYALDKSLCSLLQLLPFLLHTIPFASTSSLLLFHILNHFPPQRHVTLRPRHVCCTYVCFVSVLSRHQSCANFFGSDRVLPCH
jgi:hypothetical protein